MQSVDIEAALAATIIPGLPIEKIMACYAAAPGKEIESDKFFSPNSSAALVANTFGLFLESPEQLPPLPGTVNLGWPAINIKLECVVRLPWSGGSHPCLDVLINTRTALIGVESKRYEPFRRERPELITDWSSAYSRKVWGSAMRGYELIRDELSAGGNPFGRLDAAQLVKHAFGLRTAVYKKKPLVGKQPVLFYLYVEPARWPSGKGIAESERSRHRAEIDEFSAIVRADEVAFHSCSYRALLDEWSTNPSKRIRDHAAAVAARFAV